MKEFARSRYVLCTCLASSRLIRPKLFKPLLHETKEVTTSANMSFGRPNYKCFELINKFGDFE